MKNLLVLVALVSIVCLSCDSRKTKKESLEQAVSAFNLKTTPVQSATYHPESYVEIVTDTIISNSVQVRIKNYSLLDEQILISDATNGVTKKVNYQRVFESDISVFTATKDILNTHISAKQISAIDADPFWDNATLQHAWVNQELSTAEDIKLDITFINPIDDTHKLYRMSIDSNGQQTLNLIEAQS
ncbi:hypothetical protein LX77_00807 [Gelidibacter algens]|uniref:Uncharacterized protein n=1 Tax=Gelidibacter algens TaxID=49280 RepID=A0A1A7R0N1_9FLAO|nr:hypothetical protein [Gelidibacter algens]OBX25044.1 hypothetical protein A9996_12155 [Gelidibacter algens]RAJ26557.1 hypothetical protein LX77_00807 [Gelidibacter algens]